MVLTRLDPQQIWFESQPTRTGRRYRFLEGTVYGIGASPCCRVAVVAADSLLSQSSPSEGDIPSRGRADIKDRTTQSKEQERPHFRWTPDRYRVHGSALCHTKVSLFPFRSADSSPSSCLCLRFSSPSVFYPASCGTRTVTGIFLLSFSAFSL